MTTMPIRVLVWDYVFSDLGETIELHSQINPWRSVLYKCVATRDKFDISKFKLQVKEILKDMKEQRKEGGKEGRKEGKEGRKKVEGNKEEVEKPNA